MAENKYLRGKIYKIVSPSTDRIYIGSTAEPTLACRMRAHLKSYRDWLAGKRNYMSSYELIELGDSMIELVEAFPCESRDELRAREQHHIVINAAVCVNMQAAHRTPEEARAYANEAFTCACGGRFTRAVRSIHIGTMSHQQYLAGGAINPQVQKRWAYTEEMRLTDPKNEKFDCECGGKYTRQAHSIHRRTAKHQRYITAQNAVI